MRLWPIFLLALPEYHYHNLPVNADIIIRYPIVYLHKWTEWYYSKKWHTSDSWIFHMWWELTNQSFPSLAGGSSLTIDFSLSSQTSQILLFFLEFHLKRHHLMTKLFTSLHTKVHKSEAYLKSVQKGMSHSIAHQKAVDFMVQRTWTSCPSHRSFFVSTL